MARKTRKAGRKAMVRRARPVEEQPIGFANAELRRAEDDHTKCANALFRSAQQLAGGNLMQAFAYIVGAAVMTGEDFVDEAPYNMPTNDLKATTAEMGKLSDHIAGAIAAKVDSRYEQRKRIAAQRREEADKFKP